MWICTGPAASDPHWRSESNNEQRRPARRSRGPRSGYVGVRAISRGPYRVTDARNGVDYVDVSALAVAEAARPWECRRRASPRRVTDRAAGPPRLRTTTARATRAPRRWRSVLGGRFSTLGRAVSAGLLCKIDLRKRTRHIVFLEPSSKKLRKKCKGFLQQK